MHKNEHEKLDNEPEISLKHTESLNMNVEHSFSVMKGVLI